MIFLWVFVISSNFALAHTGHRHEIRSIRFDSQAACEGGRSQYMISDHYRRYSLDRDLDLRVEFCRPVPGR